MSVRSQHIVNVVVKAFERKARTEFISLSSVVEDDIEAEALSMELEQIRLMREAGRLTNADARELREEVYMLQMGLEAR